jgi:hypothetical protein
MAEKKNNSITRFIVDMLMIASSLLKCIPKFLYILESEAAAAGRGLIYLVVLHSVAIALLMSTWSCLLLMCFIYFISLHLSWLLSLFIIIIINILLLIIIGLVISRTITNLSFSQTRHLLKKIKR